MTTSTWHFMNAQGEQVGPVTRIALMQLYRLKQLGPSTRVFAEHLDGWQQYDAVPELGDVAAGSTSRHVLAPAESEHVTTEWDTSRGMRLLGEAGAVHCTISGVVSVPDSRPCMLLHTRSACAAIIFQSRAQCDSAQLIPIPLLATGTQSLSARPIVDGEVRDGNDVAVAYIEENGSVGNARLEYLGEVSHAGHVLNQQGELVGEVWHRTLEPTRHS